jgi:RNA polymerase sigma factor (sigma-70 family)
MSQIQDRYWFDKNYGHIPIENEEKVINKYKKLVPYTLRRIQHKDCDKNDLLSAGYHALLKRLRYLNYCRNILKDELKSKRDFFTQNIKKAMLNELRKRLDSKARVLRVIDDYETADRDGKMDDNIKLTNNEAVYCVSWRDVKLGKNVVKTIKPAITGNPEEKVEFKIKMERIMEIVMSLPEKQKDAILEYFGFTSDEELSYGKLGLKYGISQSSMVDRINRAMNNIKRMYKEKYKDEV